MRRVPRTPLRFLCRHTARSTTCRLAFAYTLFVHLPFHRFVPSSLPRARALFHVLKRFTAAYLPAMFAFHAGWTLRATVRTSLPLLLPYRLRAQQRRGGHVAVFHTAVCRQLPANARDAARAAIDHAFLARAPLTPTTRVPSRGLCLLPTTSVFFSTSSVAAHHSLRFRASYSTGTCYTSYFFTAPFCHSAC